MNSDKLRMGRISYINASPVYYGLDRGLAPDWLTLVTDVPAALNHQIRTGEVDISPISAAFYGMTGLWEMEEIWFLNFRLSVL